MASLSHAQAIGRWDVQNSGYTVTQEIVSHSFRGRYLLSQKTSLSLSTTQKICDVFKGLAAALHITSNVSYTKHLDGAPLIGALERGAFDEESKKAIKDAFEAGATVTIYFSLDRTKVSCEMEDSLGKKIYQSISGNRSV